MYEKEILDLLLVNNRDAFEQYMETLTQLSSAKKKNPDLARQEKDLRKSDMSPELFFQIAKYPKSLCTEVMTSCLCELTRLDGVVKFDIDRKELSQIRNQFFKGMCLALDYYSAGKMDPTLTHDDVYSYEDCIKDTMDVRSNLVRFCVQHKVPTHLLTSLDAYKMTIESFAKQKYGEDTPEGVKAM